MKKLILQSIIIVAILLITVKLTAQKLEGVYVVNPNPNGITAISDLYDTVPDQKNCNPGVLKEAEKQKALSEVNYIRTLHGLKTVTYNYNDDKYTAQASLIMGANATLTHTPDASLHCYSADGYTGANQSNLYLLNYSSESQVTSTEDIIIGWLFDNNSANAQNAVGHRRAILNPFLSSISFGRVDGVPYVSGTYGLTTGSALEWMDNLGQTLTDWGMNYVGYPYQNYPSELFDKDFYLSFSAIYNIKSYYDNSVDYTAATISMVDSNNKAITIHDINSDNDCWGGIRNVLVWKADNLQDNMKYTVTITNVKCGTKTNDYTYWFILGEYVAPSYEQPTLLSPANNAKSQESSIDFTWKRPTNATGFHIQVSTASDFSSNIVDSTNYNDTILHVTGLSLATTYYWRVLAIYTAGQSYYQGPWNFKTKATTPAGPLLSTPGDQETDVSLTTKFIWNAISSAKSYTFQISLDTNFKSNIIKDTTISIYRYVAYQGLLSPLTKYYWRALASTISGQTDWSTIWNFTTKNVTSVDDINLKYNDNFIYNYPNPCSNNTTIFFNLISSGDVTIKLYNALGNVIETIVSGYYDKGSYNFNYDINNLGSGVYYYQITTDTFSKVNYLNVIR